MSKKYDYDYTIIGSGPAGTTAALALAKTKKRIAIVEGRFFGGGVQGGQHHAAGGGVQPVAQPRARPAPLQPVS